MKTLLVLFISLLLVGVAQAQVICTQIGAFLSCDAPRQSTTQLDLGNGMGVITDSQGNVEPYAIIRPNQPQRPVAPQAPRAPQPPRAPSFQSDLYDPSVLPTVPLYVPYSFGGDAGQ
jgi:hypothetical protein